MSFTVMIIGILGGVCGVLLAIRYNQQRHAEIRERLKRQRGSIPLRDGLKRAA